MSEPDPNDSRAVSDDDLARPHKVWTLIAVETTSLLGSEISRFGVSLWVSLHTQSIAAVSALMLANYVPGMIARPFAGVAVDRLSRKAVMIGAALVALCGSAIIFAGALGDTLSVPMVVAGASLASIAESFQWPALAATIPLLASDEALPRYNGFLESGRAVSSFAGPAIGGFAIAFIGLAGLVAIELVTFVVATAVVATMFIPRPPAGAPAEGGDPDSSGSLRDDLTFGFRWIYQHKPLLKFQLVATFANAVISIGLVLMPLYAVDLVSEREFGIANAMFGAGMFLGGVIYAALSARLTNIQQFLGTAVLLALAYIAYGFARGIVTLGGLNVVIAIMISMGNAALMTIWQRKVPNEMQGRVLSAMMLLADITMPVSFVLAAPLTERVLPGVLGALHVDGLWHAELAKVAQMGAMFSVMGIVMLVGFGTAWAVRDVRHVEDGPTYDQVDEPPAPTA